MLPLKIKGIYVPASGLLYELILIPPAKTRGKSEDEEMEQKPQTKGVKP